MYFAPLMMTFRMVVLGSLAGSPSVIAITYMQDTKNGIKVLDTDCA